MSNELVLIVEDEFAIADLLEMALIDGGFRVVMAGNGRQGLQRLDPRSPSGPNHLRLHDAGA